MTISRDKVPLIIVLLGWAVIGYVVLDYNLGLGETTLRWPNPRHNSAAWSWDATEQTPTILEPQSGQWLRVTLPRGFSQGILQVETKESQTLQLRAETRNRDQARVQSETGVAHTLSFRWADLVARGKTFRFRLENPTGHAIKISTISLTATR